MYSSAFRHQRRTVGVVVIEFAMVMTLLVPALLFGLWEMGRLIHVKQIVANASREGARLASQAVLVQGNGSYRQIFTSKEPEDATTPTIRKSVYASLLGAGLLGPGRRLQQSDVTISFAFLDQNIGRAHPYQEWKTGAGFPQKGEKFEVIVTIPYAKVRWVNLNPYSRDMSGDMVTSRTEWRILVDDPFTINTSPLSINP